jgi:hypothetical protein
VEPAPANHSDGAAKSRSGAHADVCPEVRIWARLRRAVEQRRVAPLGAALGLDNNFRPVVKTRVTSPRKRVDAGSNPATGVMPL